MATPRTSGQLLANIASDLADNNAGLISAADVRNNLADTAASINIIVASGDTNTQFPFIYDVRAQVQNPGTGGATGGSFIVESGLMFPNSPVNSTSRQVQPFLGVDHLDHNSLANLTVGDPHTQYLPVNGSRPMQGNLPMTNGFWIGPSGNNNEGFKFIKKPTGVDIITSGTQQYGDGSRQSSAKGISRAWLNFDASGVGNVPVVRASHNISKLERLAQGKFRITFNSGLFADNNYVVSALSNGTTGSGSQEDFENNQVACVIRTGDDGTALRTCTFVIMNNESTYVDGKINDFVAFGNQPNVTADATPTIVGI